MKSTVEYVNGILEDRYAQDENRRLAEADSDDEFTHKRRPPGKLAINILWWRMVNLWIFRAAVHEYEIRFALSYH